MFEKIVKFKRRNKFGLPGLEIAIDFQQTQFKTIFDRS